MTTQEIVSARIENLLKQVEESHLRSIRLGSKAVHIDVGVHFCPVCRESIKRSVAVLIDNLSEEAA